MRVLVTRPQDDGERTARALRERGHEVLLAPLLQIEPIRDAELGGGPWSAIAFTSATAAQVIATHPAKPALLPVPVFAVGARTAAAAQAAGFADVKSCDGDVTALARAIGICARTADRRDPVLYPAGQERARDLAELLAPFGLIVETVPVYRAVMAETFPADVRNALAANAIDAVLHFSRRTARAFLAALDRAALRPDETALRHVCLSADVAAPLIAAGARSISIAPHPSQQALLDLLAEP